MHVATGASGKVRASFAPQHRVGGASRHQAAVASEPVDRMLHQRSRIGPFTLDRLVTSEQDTKGDGSAAMPTMVRLSVDVLLALPFQAMLRACMSHAAGQVGAL
jgi:hypothetical protein